MGNDTERFSSADLAALLWVLAGFLLYGLFPNKNETQGEIAVDDKPDFSEVDSKEEETQEIIIN